MEQVLIVKSEDRSWGLYMDTILVGEADTFEGICELYSIELARKTNRECLMNKEFTIEVNIYKIPHGNFCLCLNGKIFKEYPNFQDAEKAYNILTKKE